MAPQVRPGSTVGAAEPTEHSALVHPAAGGTGKPTTHRGRGFALRVIIGTTFAVSLCIGAYHVVYERQHLFAAGPEVMEVAKLDGIAEAKAAALHYKSSRTDMGGSVPLDIADEQVQLVGKYILAEINCMKCSCDSGCTDKTMLHKYTVKKASGQVVSGEAVDVSLDIDGLDVEAIVWMHAAGTEELEECPVIPGVYDFEGQYSTFELQQFTIDGKDYSTSHKEAFCTLHAGTASSKKRRARRLLDLHSKNQEAARAKIERPHGYKISASDKRMFETMSKVKIDKAVCEKWYPALKTHTPAQLKKKIPGTFDSRKVYKYCNAKFAKDQGQCGSCWAFAAATTMSWRLCVLSKGVFNEDISPQGLLSCTYPASDGAPQKGGCGGGSTIAPFGQIIHKQWPVRVEREDRYSAHDATGIGATSKVATSGATNKETCKALPLDTKMPCVTEKVAAKRKQLVEWDIYKATDHQNFLSAKDMGDSDPKPFGTLRNPFDKYHNQEGVNIGYTCELKDSTCKTGLRLCTRAATLSVNKTKLQPGSKWKNHRLPTLTKTKCFGDWTEADVKKYEIMIGGAVPAGMTTQKGWADSPDGIKPTKCDGKAKDPGGHAVALVGWGESHGMKYWVVQNSHSKEFGNHGYTHILRDENDKTPCKDAKGKSDREDCCLNELKFNMLSSVMDPDLDNMPKPLLSCSNGGRLNAKGDGCVCRIPYEGAGVKRVDATKTTPAVNGHMGCTTCMLTVRKQKGLTMCSNGGVGDEKDCSCACPPGFGGGLCDDKITLKLVRAQKPFAKDTKVCEDLPGCPEKSDGGQFQKCHDKGAEGDLLRKNCQKSCCQCGDCATCAADGYQSGYTHIGYPCSKNKADCKKYKKHVGLFTRGQCKKTCGMCAAHPQEDKLAQFEITVTGVATGFLPTGGDYIGVSTTGSASSTWINHGIHGKPQDFCGAKAKWNDKATIAECSKHVQANGAFSMKQTFSMDVSAAASLYVRYVQYNGVNEFGHDKGFSTTFGGKRYFAEWHNPAQHCSPVLVQVTKGTSTTALQWKITDVGGQVVGSPAAGAMTHGGDTYRFCIRKGKTEFLAIDSSGSGWSGGSYKVTLVSTGKELINSKSGFFPKGGKQKSDHFEVPFEVSSAPTAAPTTSAPTKPTGSPTTSPTGSPTTSPTKSPTLHPSASPSERPSTSPTAAPTANPSASPTAVPTMFSGVQMKFDGKVTKRQAESLAKSLLDKEGGGNIASADITLEDDTQLDISLPATVSLVTARAAFTAQVKPGTVTAFKQQGAQSSKRRMASTGKTYTAVVQATGADIATVAAKVDPAAMKKALSSKLKVPEADVGTPPVKVSTKVSVKTANTAVIAKSKANKPEDVENAMTAAGLSGVALTKTYVNGVATGGAARESLAAGLAMLCLTVVWGALA